MTFYLLITSGGCYLLDFVVTMLLTLGGDLSESSFLFLFPRTVFILLFLFFKDNGSSDLKASPTVLCLDSPFAVFLLLLPIIENIEH
jgi:hypothetical protein